jgi:hypothetical protein
MNYTRKKRLTQIKMEKALNKIEPTITNRSTCSSDLCKILLCCHGIKGESNRNASREEESGCQDVTWYELDHA